LNVSTKSSAGNFFEDFRLGATYQCPTPRRISDGDVALYLALTGDRTAAYCDGEALVHPLLVFHVIFGQTVRFVSLNALANLGYAEVVWGSAVRVGAVLSTELRVVGLKENSSGKSGIVYVETVGRDERRAEVLRFKRWVMVRKRSAVPTAYRDAPVVPSFLTSVGRSELCTATDALRFAVQTGGHFGAEDYRVGERIAHGDAMVINPSDHMLLTRLAQNSARVHFDAHAMDGRPLVYGGVVISHGYAMSHAGLEHRMGIVAVNGGTHANPTYAGDTLYAMTEVLDVAADLTPGIGALRLRMVVIKNGDFGDVATYDPMEADPRRDGAHRYRSNVVLDLDYWELMPTRTGEVG